MAQQSLSDEEFHRLQMQLIEIRTENYKLKDENKKHSVKLRELTERETKLDKELNKQIKMKKALSTLNKSRQAQEYEALLQQMEQEFALQNRTLMAELTKLTLSVETLEKENRQMKHSGNVDPISNTDSEFRRLQAENKALKNSIKNTELHHQQELDEQTQALTHPKSPPSDRNDQSPGSEHPLCDDTPVERPLDGSILNDERLLRAEAQCERFKQQLIELQDVKMMYATEKEEKSLLQSALSEAKSHHMREQRALEGEVEAFREKLDKKQVVCLELQEEKENLIKEIESVSSEAELLRESFTLQREDMEEQMRSEIASLGNALQSAQNLIESHQSENASYQSEFQAMKAHQDKLVQENNQLKELLGAAQEKEQLRANEKQGNMSRERALEDRLKQTEATLERMAMEREDSVTKFEESARASGALLQQVNQVEHSNDLLRRELEEAKELAEKRKRVMDKQAVESQEMSARFSEQITALKSGYEVKSQESRELNGEKIALLEATCKKQEQELIRINHQDRTKTRELDSCQQQVRDMQASMTSLESSKGWFERALKDAEAAAAVKEEEHQVALEQTKVGSQKEIDIIKTLLEAKDDVIAECEVRVNEANQEASKRDGTIESLKQEIADEINKQKLIEKKGHTNMKDLKRQLHSEKKRNEKLQEKLRDLSTSNSNLDELLQVPEDKDGDGSSTSSFSFREFLSPNRAANNDTSSQAGSGSTASAKKSSAPSPNMSRGETKELLSRITNLQQEKWNLEEQVRHLEESASAMAEELLGKTKLMQDYVQHTRTDHQRARTSNEELGGPKRFGDRMKSIITGQQGADVNNIRELNRKLTRMLEEEMTKNMRMKEDIVALSSQLAADK